MTPDEAKAIALKRFAARCSYSGAALARPLADELRAEYAGRFGCWAPQEPDVKATDDGLRVEWTIRGGFRGRETKSLLIPWTEVSSHLQGVLRMAKKKQTTQQQSAQKSLVRFACEFRGVGIGELTGRIGVRLARDNVSLEQADKFLCGRRLTATAELKSDDARGQTHLPDLGPQRVKAVFDVKRFGVAPERITTGLTFNLKEVALGDIAALANKAGWLDIEAVNELPDDEDEDDDETDSEERESAEAYDDDGQTPDGDSNGHAAASETVKLLKSIDGYGNHLDCLIAGRKVDVIERMQRGRIAVRTARGMRVEIGKADYEELPTRR